MKNCEIKSPPAFTVDITRWDRETDADGDAMVLVVEQVFNNTVYNKQKAEQALGILLPGRMIRTEDWDGLTYTIEHESIKKGSTVYIGYTFDSIPIAQKANIRGKTEQGKLILVATKAPSADIEVEEIRVLNLNER